MRREQFHVAGLHSEKPQDVRFEIISTMKEGTHTRQLFLPYTVECAELAKLAQVWFLSFGWSVENITYTILHMTIT